MKHILLALALGVCITANAQLHKTDDVKKSLETTNKDTVAWVHGGILSIGANEGFLHNWAAGGELLSLAANGIFSGHLDRLHHRMIWSNNLDLSYGLNYIYSTGFTPRKTDDRIDFTSRYGRRLDGGNTFLTALFNFKSQFTKGFDYSKPNFDSAATSAFLSPGYLTLALGADYRRGENLSLFLSPLAGRLILADKFYTAMSPAGAFGVDSGKTSKFQLGAYFSGRYTININKRTLYRTRLDLYSNYLAKDIKDPSGKVVKKDNPGNIDVLFDNLFTWKATKFFSITLGATFIYDNDIPYNKTKTDATGTVVNKTSKDDPGVDMGWLQINQVFTLGLEYKF